MSFQTKEEIQELLLQQLEDLFDRPCLKQINAPSESQNPTEINSSRQPTSQNQIQQQQPVYKVLYEKDQSQSYKKQSYQTNTFLITNPQAIFKLFVKKQFLQLTEQSQLLLLERLEDLLQKCPHNIHILTDHLQNQNFRRLNQTKILVLKPPSTLEEQQNPSLVEQQQVDTEQDNDLLLLLIEICLKIQGKVEKTAKKLFDLIRKITQLKRFSKFHVEYIFQYLKYKCTMKAQKGKSQQAMQKLDGGIKILQSMFEPKFEFGPTSYFYFSGYLSGIQVNTKNMQSWPFGKGFAASIWFQLSDSNLQDNNNLPVLFNAFSQGFGGFECYFNQKRLYYRILQKNYTLPTTESNRVLIGEKDFEFDTKKWYFLGIEHDKPYLARAQLNAFINDKHVVKFLPVDYPKFDKNAKVSIISICKNFVGQMSTFILFKEQINNTKKFSQMYQHYEQGIFSNNQLKALNNDIFESKLTQKFFLFYCPERTYNKIVYDCVDLNDGELMVNSGTYNSGPKSKLFYSGGLNSLLPLLDYIQQISNSSIETQQSVKLNNTINEYLRLVNSIISSKSYFPQEGENSHFFKIMFHMLSKLHRNAVNSQTIQLLAEIRFQIGDSILQEQFFQNLLYNSDFWINTDNVEVINEFWSFIKAIYSQNPVQYNKTFSIQNLIDLMIRISDIKDGFCCEYHKNTSSMIYSGQLIQSSRGTVENEVNYNRSSQASFVNIQLGTGGGSIGGRQSNLGINTSHLEPKSSIKQSVVLLNDPFQQHTQKIYYIDKFLAPISGVLEGVLTSGGNEILDQIQYVAKSLTIKSSPCFHLQMLKLLKVLLLDSKEDRHCASPVDFAAHFLNAKGLQILLYLCSNSSFDVKSMCIKLIDVLSSHTSLIKMRIDTDLITYMCSIILPKQTIDKNFGSTMQHKVSIQGVNPHSIMPTQLVDIDAPVSTPQLTTHHYQMIEEEEYTNTQLKDEEDEQDSHQIIRGNQSFDESSNFQLTKDNVYESLSTEKHILDALKGRNQPFDSKAKQSKTTINFTKEIKENKPKKFGAGLFIADDEDESGEEENEDLNSYRQSDDKVDTQAEIVQTKSQKSRQFHHNQALSLGGSKDDKNQLEQTKKNNLLRKTENKQQQFEQEEEEFQLQGPRIQGPRGKKAPQLKFDFEEPKSKIGSKMNQTGLQGRNLNIGSQDEDSNEDQDEVESLKGKQQTRFEENDDQMLDQFEKKKFMNTQKLPSQSTSNKNTFGGNKFMKKGGLELNLFPPPEPLKTSKARQIMFTEQQDEDKELELQEQFSKKKNVKSEFANENVMSKSNLRQPKSFNFGSAGGGDDDSSDSERELVEEQKERVQDYEEDDYLEEIKVQQKQKTETKSSGRPQILLMQKGFGGSSANKSSKAPFKKPQLNTFEETEAVSDNEQGGKKKEDKYQQKHIIKEEEEEDEEDSNKKQTKKAVINFKQKAKIFTNTNAKLNLDTEEINKLFTYGGEKGEIKMTADEEEVNFEKEIDELARLCLASQRRKNPSDQVEYDEYLRGAGAGKPTFEQKFLQGDNNQSSGNNSKIAGSGGSSSSQNPRKQFMTPQSVRGIKKIEFQMNQEKKQKGIGQLANKTGTFSNQTIVEEQSPVGTSKSSSSKNDFNFLGTNSGPLQLTQNSEMFSQKEQTIDNASDLQLLPQKIISDKSNKTGQKLSNKQQRESIQKQSQQQLKKDAIDIDGSQQNNETQQLMQGFGDETGSDEYTQELENLYTSCLEWLLNRAPSSLYQNIVVDDFDKICFAPALSLLMTLVSFSNNLLRQKALQDLYMLARWDQYNGTRILEHPQFHNWLLDLLMPYQDLANSYVNLLGQSQAVYDMGCKVHTLLLKNACITPEEDAYKRINYVARWPQIVASTSGSQEYNRLRNQREFETANKLSRILLTQLLVQLKDESIRQKPAISDQNPTWKNIIHTTFLVEEVLLATKTKEFSAEGKQTNGEGDMGRDVNSSILSWIQKDFLFYFNGSNEKNLWAEWDLIEALFQALDSLYSEQFFRKTNNKSDAMQSIEENVFTILEKSSADDFNQDVEILMFDGKSSNNMQQATTSPISNNKQGEVKGQNEPKKGKKNILTMAAQALNLSQPLNNIMQHSPPSSSSESSFMNTILNLLCIALAQSDTKQLVQLWLERFERYVKFLMIVSEAWKSRHITHYNIVQRKLQDTIAFAMTFLFHEIHTTNRKQSSQILTSSLQMSSSSFVGINNPSPKDQIFNKIFAQSLKNLMIYFLNVIEYSKIRYTPTQLESQVHLTACRGILTNVLTRSQAQQEPLISLKDVSRYKASDYDDFPECFYMEDWKVAFFDNKNIKDIIQKQLTYKLIEQHVLKRKTYAMHVLEMQGRTDKTKDDILKRMQSDTLDVISTLSEFEFERKNKVALLNENQIREQKYYWKKAKKILFGQRGVWRHYGSKYQTTLNMNINELTRGMMEDRDSNGFIFIQNEDVERKVFKIIDKVDMHIPSQGKDKKSIEYSGPSAKKQTQEKKKDKMFQDSEEEEEEDDEEEENEELVEKVQEMQQSVEFFSKTLTTREKMSLKKSYITHLKEYLMANRPKCKEILAEMKCYILKPFYQRPGSVVLTSYDILFFDDIYTPQNQQTYSDYQNIFFFAYQKHEDDLFYKVLPLQNIKEIQRRRFLGRKAALEFFMMDNTSYLLNFASTEERDQFAKKVIRQRNQKCQNLKYYDTLEPKRILKKRELTEKWQQWKISNFEYIMQLNMLAGRSFNDLSQYPVFPWTIVDFTSEQQPDLNAISYSQGSAAPQGFRDLNKNMQLLGSAERQAVYKSKYEDPDNEQQKFHCGSHYSNPGIVLHYLCRLSPYIDAYVELHEKGLDKPDRTFSSLMESLNSALNDQTDIRELIPEFFYSPEMFMNKNFINFGIRQDEVEVNDVKMPPWSNQDPYLFVTILREAFESNYVSQNLGGWINYIFGCKQKDKEAEMALNTFSNLTYEDGIDLDQIQDEMMKKSYESQIYNFGQTPSQLFQKDKKHPNKIQRGQIQSFSFVIDTQAKVRVYKPVVQQQALQQKNQANQMKVLICSEAILKAKFVDDQSIIGINKDGTVTYFIWLSRAHQLNPQTPFTCCEDRKKKYEFRTKLGGVEMYDRSIKKFDFPMLIMLNGRMIVRGGFWDGKLQLCPFEGQYQEQVITFTVHQSTITSIATTSNEKIIFTGSKLGDLVIWNNNFGSSTNEPLLTVWKHFCDHEGQISSINVNEDMNFFLTSSYDGTANLYNLWNCKLIRSFQHPNLVPIHVGIMSQTPLQCVGLFSREDHLWHSFSINGKLLDTQKEDSAHLIAPQIIKDSLFMDKLLYGTERGYVIIRSLPYLKVTKKLQVSNNFPVLSILISVERKFMLVGCGDGGLNVITEPFNQASSSSQQQLQQNKAGQQQTQVTSGGGNAVQSTTTQSSQGNTSTF